MSKFIRTKERVDLLRKGVDKYIVKDSDYTCEITIDEETLLKNYKVADTIEELCDEFVNKDNVSRLPHTFVPRGHWTYEECKEWCSNEYDSKNDYELYGAIWTDKGLIYVAKLNDKGDLELI